MMKSYSGFYLDFHCDYLALVNPASRVNQEARFIGAKALFSPAVSLWSFVFAGARPDLQPLGLPVRAREARLDFALAVFAPLALCCPSYLLSPFRLAGLRQRQGQRLPLFDLFVQPPRSTAWNNEQRTRSHQQRLEVKVGVGQSRSKARWETSPSLRSKKQRLA